MPETKIPKIKVSVDALKKIRVYTALAEKEIFGLLEIEETKVKDGEMYLLVTDLHIPEQEASFGDCEPTKGAVSKLLGELDKAGRDISKIRGWFHKHPINTWSGIDDSTFEAWRRTRPYVVGIFTNDNSIVARVDLNIWGIETSIDNVSIEIDIPIDEKFIEECRKEMKEKVKERTSSVPTADPWRFEERYYQGGRYPFHYTQRKDGSKEKEQSTSSSEGLSRECIVYPNLVCNNTFAQNIHCESCPIANSPLIPELTTTDLGDKIPLKLYKKMMLWRRNVG